MAQQRCALDPRAVRFETWEAWDTAVDGTAPEAAIVPIGCPDPLPMGMASGLAEDPTDLGDAQQTALILAMSRCLLDPRASSFPTWDAWVTAMQLGSAVFAAATTTEDVVRCRIAHEERTLKATGAQWYVTPGAWIETLQTYWLGGQGLVQKLVTAVDATDPQVVADPETVNRLLYPPMEMFHRFVRGGDREDFNLALAQALQWHKEYWSEESRAAQTSGFVALAPLAVACIAHDAGIPIEVDSEYLPLALLGRNWCGEFAT
ncbi:immunity 49 family protein [Streptomyces sp. NPDC057197]|uniref:immunity 49 family protein n=1 Tax=Streptomyces sp. NPDC057197 TaxID=3346045 RepID=UPI00363737BF